MSKKPRADIFGPLMLKRGGLIEQAGFIVAVLWLAGCSSGGSGPGSPSVGGGGGDGATEVTDGGRGQASDAMYAGADAGTVRETGGAGHDAAPATDAALALDAAPPNDAAAADRVPIEDAATDAATDGGVGRRLQILPLGDSITFGYDGSNAGYRGPLYNLLKRLAPSVLYVGSSVEGTVTTTTDPLPGDQRHNEGHGSYTINDVGDNLDGVNTAEFDRYGGANRDPNGGHWLDGIADGARSRPALYPDVITLMIGTNNAADADRTAVRIQLHALITKITTLRPNTRLIVAQITPSNRPNNATYNADVATEVKSFRAAGKPVSMVDLYTGFPADGLSGDGVHPNDKGFAFMAQQWFDAIAAVVDLPSGSVR